MQMMGQGLDGDPDLPELLFQAAYSNGCTLPTDLQWLKLVRKELTELVVGMQDDIMLFFLLGAKVITE